MAIPEEKVLRGIYGDAAKEAEARFEKLQGTYEAQFGQEELTCFSAPGRTEIIGNHTDHNGGKILAASITMDTIAVAAKTGDSVVTILSEGYPDPIVVDTDHLEKIPKCQGSLSLVGGMLKAARDEFGYRIGGFNACVSTQVISSAGVSSSASFEMLVCAILNEFFNGGSIDYAHYARIGQYAENRYWDKASGLMDQMACAVGGTIYLDFGGGEVKYEKVDFGFDQLGCDLVIVNTGKGHADLSAEYSSIPEEMRLVAKELGGTNLCDCTEEDLLAKLPEIRSKIGNDRAILRALHYYEECRDARHHPGVRKQLLEVAPECVRRLGSEGAVHPLCACPLRALYEEEGQGRLPPARRRICRRHRLHHREGGHRGVCGISLPVSWQ